MGLGIGNHVPNMRLVLRIPKQPSVSLWSLGACNWVGNSGKNLNRPCAKDWRGGIYCMMGCTANRQEGTCPAMGECHLADILIQFAPA